MIRPATTDDIAAIVAMTERLRASVTSPLPVDAFVTARFVAGLLEKGGNAFSVGAHILPPKAVEFGCVVKGKGRHGLEVYLAYDSGVIAGSFQERGY